MKECNKCEKTKSVEEFHKNSRSPDGLHSICKECKNTKARETYSKKPTEPRPKGFNLREYQLKRKYGITLEQYDQLLEKQNHCCAICERHKSEFKTQLAVDHSHKTGLIRGLLCTACNYRLVAKHEDGDLLRKIADYIENPTDWAVPEAHKKPKRKRKRKAN